MYNTHALSFILALFSSVQAMPRPQGSAPCTSPPALNSASIDLIKDFEGFVDSPYDDTEGNPTVGYGHLCSDSDCSDVPYSFPMSESEGEELLQSDVQEYELCLANAIAGPISLNDNQYGALTSWTYNEGCGNMESSTLISRLNDGEDPDTVAADELPQWVYAGGEKLDGLERRRDAEVQLFQTSSDTGAIPC